MMVWDHGIINPFKQEQKALFVANERSFSAESSGEERAVGYLSIMILEP